MHNYNSLLDATKMKSVNEGSRNTLYLDYIANQKPIRCSAFSKKEFHPKTTSGFISRRRNTMLSLKSMNPMQKNAPNTKAWLTSISLPFGLKAHREKNASS